MKIATSEDAWRPRQLDPWSGLPNGVPSEPVASGGRLLAYRYSSGSDSRRRTGVPVNLRPPRAIYETQAARQSIRSSRIVDAWGFTASVEAHNECRSRAAPIRPMNSNDHDPDACSPPSVPVHPIATPAVTEPIMRDASRFRFFRESYRPKLNEGILFFAFPRRTYFTTKAFVPYTAARIGAGGTRAIFPNAASRRRVGPCLIPVYESRNTRPGIRRLGERAPPTGHAPIWGTSDGKRPDIIAWVLRRYAYYGYGFQ